MGSYSAVNIGIKNRGVSQQILKEFLICVGCKGPAYSDGYGIININNYFPDVEMQVEDEDNLIEYFEIFNAANYILGPSYLYVAHEEEENTSDWQHRNEFILSPNGKGYFGEYAICHGDGTYLDGKNAYCLLKDKIEKAANEQGIDIEWEIEKEFCGELMVIYPVGEEFEELCDDILYETDQAELTTVIKEFNQKPRKPDMQIINKIKEEAQKNGFEELNKLIKI